MSVSNVAFPQSEDGERGRRVLREAVSKVALGGIRVSPASESSPFSAHLVTDPLDPPPPSVNLTGKFADASLGWRLGFRSTPIRPRLLFPLERIQEKESQPLVL